MTRTERLKIIRFCVTVAICIIMIGFMSVVVTVLVWLMTHTRMWENMEQGIVCLGS